MYKNILSQVLNNIVHRQSSPHKRLLVVSNQCLQTFYHCTCLPSLSRLVITPETLPFWGPQTLQIRQKSVGNPKKFPYPPLDEAEIEEHFMLAGGPGGQAMQKTRNKVLVTHKPSGVSATSHNTRSLEQNRKIAREYLQAKIDWYYNRENSFAEQDKKKNAEKRQKKLRKSKIVLEKKKAFKEREGLD